MKVFGVGVVGCGNISDIYLTNITKKFKNLKLVALCDLDEEKVMGQQKKYGGLVVDLETLLKMEEVDIVLNITTPKTHRMVCERALMAGKHTYVEKPLSLTLEDGKALVELARQKGLYIGGAPDTFLGAGIETCKKLIEDGYIGDLVGAHASFTCPGHERWHPDPEFYYEAGGGPLLDMGPYYLTALAYLIGPIKKVYGSAKLTHETRTITSEKKYGKIFPVEVPTHVCAQMTFASGAVGQLVTSFDVWASELPRIEIQGTKGTLMIPDPNTFGGPIRLHTSHDQGFKEVPLLFDHAENSRGLGLSRMAQAIEEGTDHPADGKLTYHVLEVMLAILESAQRDEVVSIHSTL